MTFLEALWKSLRFVVILGSFIGLLFWTIASWVEGKWWEKIASLAALVVLFAVVIWIAEVPPL